jgi:hypothetical protein
VTIDPDTGLAPKRLWTWELPVRLRWLLRGDVNFDDSYDDVPLALCAETEGQFVDLPPRPRERFTLVGCTPAGVLADVLDRLSAEALGTERAWLGNISLTAPAPPPDTAPSWWGADLGDVVVLAQRPSAALPGTIDIDLDGFVRLNDRTEAVPRPLGVDEFVLLDANEAPDSTVPCGTCADATGVFRDQAPRPVPQVRFLGCRPEPRLLAALDAVGDSTEAGLRRRRIHAEVHAVATDGSAAPVTGAAVSGTVTATEPSRLGAELLDVTVDVEWGEPLPTGVLDILGHWRAGGPSRRNLWAGYDRELRHQWAAVALGYSSGAPERPPGATYELDGRFVTDIEGFYCALGEAINGPGGYFGWNLGAVHDCLGGGFGAQAPFRLVWHDSVVAREHLVAGYDRRELAPAITLEYLVGMLIAHGIEIDLC